MASPVSAPSARRLPPEERLVASLITLLEAGTAPWRRPWDVSAGGHHVHLLSGRPYRGSNPVLLTLGMHLQNAFAPLTCAEEESREIAEVERIMIVEELEEINAVRERTTIRVAMDSGAVKHVTHPSLSVD